MCILHSRTNLIDIFFFLTFEKLGKGDICVQLSTVPKCKEGSDF